MVKKAANPFLRTMLRAGQSHQRSAARLLTALLAPAPKPARKKAAVRKVAAPKPAVRLAIKPAIKPAVKPAVRPAVAPPVTPTAPAPGKFLSDHFVSQSGAQRMRYWLYLPATPAPPTGYALIVMLHGCEQSATLFAEGTRMNQVAGAAGHAVLYPQQPASAHPRRCWKWYDRATQQGGGDVPLIVGTLGKVMERHPLDRTRVYICGLSAGAAMAHIVALNHPELFAALGLHSGPLYGAGHSTVGALGVMRHGAAHRVDAAIAEVRGKRDLFPALPTMLIQGEDDEVVRPVNQDQLSRQAMLVNDLPSATPVRLAVKAGNKRTHPYQVQDVYRGRKLMVRVARIARLQHAWSGGDARLSYNSAPGPDASKMLVQFFAKHRRPAGRGRR